MLGGIAARVFLVWTAFILTTLVPIEGLFLGLAAGAISFLALGVLAGLIDRRRSFVVLLCFLLPYALIFGYPFFQLAGTNYFQNQTRTFSVFITSITLIVIGFGLGQRYSWDNWRR